MKLIAFFVFCTLLYSCTAPRDIDGELQGEWVFVNETNLDLNVCHNLITFDEQYGEYERTHAYFIPQKSNTSQQYDRCFNDNLINFHTFFLMYEESVVSCRIYITNTAGDMLKEWVMGEENGARDIFNEENWEYRHWETEHEEMFCGTYSAEHHEWTFTITDADLAGE